MPAAASVMIRGCIAIGRIEAAAPARSAGGAGGRSENCPRSLRSAVAHARRSAWLLRPIFVRAPRSPLMNNDCRCPRPCFARDDCRAGQPFQVFPEFNALASKWRRVHALSGHHFRLIIVCRQLDLHRTVLWAGRRPDLTNILCRHAHEVTAAINLAFRFQPTRALFLRPIQRNGGERRNGRQR